MSLSTEIVSTTIIHSCGNNTTFKPSKVLGESWYVLLWYLFACGRKNSLYEFVKAVDAGKLADREDLIGSTKYVLFNPPDDFDEYEYYLREIKEKFEILQIYCIQRCCTERDFVDQYTTVRDLVIEAINGGSVQQILEDVKRR